MVKTPIKSTESFILSHQTLTTFKIPIKDVWHDDMHDSTLIQLNLLEQLTLN